MYDLKDIARRIVEEAKALGADQVQCFVRENKKEELTLTEGAVSLHFHNFEVRTIRIAK